MDEHVFTKERCGTFQKRCKHFGGINFLDKGKACKAGVVMADITKPQSYRYRYAGDHTIYTSNHSMPCFADTDPLHVCQCEKQEFPTPEEIKAEEELWEQLFARTAKARAAIVVETKGKRGVVGEITCPICETGKLRYSVASLNGHIHAGCTTDECVNWME